MVGMWLAMHKPLWCDEISGQKIDIEGSSWREVVTGRIKGLNNPPLYFVFQKAITSIIKLHFPDDLLKDFQLPTEKRKYFLLAYPKGQIVLRMLPDILMTTAIVFLVRFFWIREGGVVGGIALLSALTSGMVWWYWVEARPYPLWFLLTLLQALFLIEILSAPKFSGKAKIHLMICNWLLVVTVTPGFIQVIIAQVILFLSGQRQLRSHVLAGVLPVCIAFSFFGIRENKPLFTVINPEEIIRLNFSFEQLSLLFFI